MDDEVELIYDGNGIAILWEPDAVQRLPCAEGLETRSAADRGCPVPGRLTGGPTQSIHRLREKCYVPETFER